MCRAARKLAERKKQIIKDEAAEYWLPEPRDATGADTATLTFGVASRATASDEEDDDVER